MAGRAIPELDASRPVQQPFQDVREIDVIAPNLKYRYSGVTSTIAALLPVQARNVRIASLGPRTPSDWPQITWSALFRHGWTPPPGRAFRIWHARRNNEMLAGLFLRSILRMPVRLVFTRAARRDLTALTRMLLRQMDALVATSPEAADHLDRPARVILHGVDVTRYRPSGNREQEWAASGLPGRYGIGVFGRVRSSKGTDIFVEAMCRLLPKYPNFTAVIVGSITTEQQLFGQQLKSRAAAAGLSERIVFLNERPSDEMPVWFRRMTIVVGPQRLEGFGLVPLEAMASGAAVVATRVGAAHHLIKEGQTGYLVEPEDLDALVARIEPLMKDPALAHDMGVKGRAHVVEHFSVEREAREIQEVYERCWKDGG